MALVDIGGKKVKDEEEEEEEEEEGMGYVSTHPPTHHR